MGRTAKRDPSLTVEMRGLRCYSQGIESIPKSGLSRRRAYYWLLTYEGRHRRSTAFQLPPEGLWPTPLGAESFRAEWGLLSDSDNDNDEEEEKVEEGDEEKEGDCKGGITSDAANAASSVSARRPASRLPPERLPGSAAGMLQVDLFESGPVGPGPAKNRGQGAEEEDEEEMDSYSIYDFNVSRVASARVELRDGRVDRWYPCTAPVTGEVISGVFIHVATWVGETVALVEKEEEEREGAREKGGQQRKSGQRHISVEGDEDVGGKQGKEDGENEGLEDSTSYANAEAGVSSFSSSPSSQLPKAIPHSPRPVLRDHFGFPIAEHAETEFQHLQSLEELRAIEQRLRWDRIKCFRPSAQRRRRHSAAAHGGAGGGEGGSSVPVVSPAETVGRRRITSTSTVSSSSFSSSPLHQSAQAETTNGAWVNDTSTGSSKSTSSSTTTTSSSSSISDTTTSSTYCSSSFHSSSSGGYKNVEALKALVWDGVPADLRDSVYQWLSGAQAKREAVGVGYYSTLAKASEEENLGLGVVGEEGEDESWVCVSREREGAGVGGGGGGGWREGKRHYGVEMGGGAAGLEVGGVKGGMEMDILMPELDAAWGAKVAMDIELDLGRAFADADAAINTAEGRAALRRVLRTYALRNPSVGYCQGMNFIAGLLLLVVSEETAFWSLAHMCEEVSPLCFSPPLLGTRADMRALGELLKAELPALYRHCDGLYLNLELMAGHWLLVYFINIFPPPVALRILEVSMAEGSDVTFAVALAFLRGLEGELLACDDLHELSQLVRRRQAAMYDADVLLHAARVQLRHMRSTLRILRAWHLGDLMKHEDEIEQTSYRRQQQQEGGRAGAAGGGGRGGGGAAGGYMPYLGAGAGGGREAVEGSCSGVRTGGGGAGGVKQRNDDRMRRLVRRSVARGLSLVGLSYWVSPHTRRHWDQMAFQVTHRLFLEEGRFRSMRFTPVLVDLMSWWMNWPILMRRTGGGELPAPNPASPPRRPAAGASRHLSPVRAIPLRRHSSSPVK
ncbi:gtpase activator nb4s calmodulin-binding protein partial [Nannochloropsis oceanica]